MKDKLTVNTENDSRLQLKSDDKSGVDRLPNDLPEDRGDGVLPRIAATTTAHPVAVPSACRAQACVKEACPARNGASMAGVIFKNNAGSSASQLFQVYNSHIHDSTARQSESPPEAAALGTGTIQQLIAAVHIGGDSFQS